MAFPQSFLDELIARNPIEDVVGRYVNLKRSGSNLFGLCPFHGEKTASFSVAPDKGMYYCFGCHKGGGVINFIMDIEGLSYPDAVRELAKRANMDVPEDEAYQNRYRQQERLWALHKDAARFYHSVLYSPAGAQGLDYARSRGMDQKTLTRFGMGFAPNAWGELTDLLRRKGYTQEELEQSGLTLTKNGHTYDRFRNRLMFPIIDVRGNVIGFGGRVMDDSTPKYLNSPETEIFNKRKNLFALNYAKKSKLGYLILVEGYMDAIALHQYGFDCAVASLGTSLTEQHAQLLSRYTQQVVLIYDGDEAGQRATQRAIPMLEQVGIQVKVLRMRDAKDPDEFLKKFGADRFKILMEEASNRVEYQLGAIRRKYDLTQDEQRVRYIQEAAGLIAQLQSPVQQEVYGRRVAEETSISYDAMKLETEKAVKRRRNYEKKKQEQQSMDPVRLHQPKSREIRYDNMRSAMAEEVVIAMTMREPALLDTTGGLKPEEFTVELFGRVFGQLLDRHKLGLETAIGSLQDLSPEESAHLAGVLTRQQGTVDEKMLRDCIGVIRSQRQTVKTEADLLALQKKLRESKGYKT